MDDARLKEILSAEAVPPAEENARKEAINLARAAFDRAQGEAREGRQGTGLLGRLTDRDQQRPKGRPMAWKHIFWGLGGGTTVALVLVSVAAVILLSEASLERSRDPLFSSVSEAPERPALSDATSPAGSPPTVAAPAPPAALAPAAKLAEGRRSAQAPAVPRQALGGAVYGDGEARFHGSPPVEQPQPHYRDVGRDQFESVAENPVKRAAEEPVSTFSIDVDTASYAFVRRELNRGVLPQKDAVRIEELINYFDYAYPLPAERARPFAPTVTVTPSPWKDGNKLIHIGIKGYDLDPEEKPRSNLVFLLDVSGSMNAPDKLPLMVSSMKLLLDGLGPEDSVAIVTYAGNAGTVLEPTPVAERHKILAALDRLGAGGSTAGAEGIRQAYALAEAGFDPEAVNRVILATDGDFNVGITDRGELKGFIERKRESGVFLSVLGFGQGNLNDHLMQTLAQNGNGVAAHIDTLNEARKVLVEEAAAALFPIAQDVKIQVEFNPGTVAEYRLIGYETRALRREDFANDRVDAGDIGAGHAVTAIYEITPVDGGDPLIAPRRYGGETTRWRHRFGRGVRLPQDPLQAARRGHLDPDHHADHPGPRDRARRHRPPRPGGPLRDRGRRLRPAAQGRHPHRRLRLRRGDRLGPGRQGRGPLRLPRRVRQPGPPRPQRRRPAPELRPYPSPLPLPWGEGHEGGHRKTPLPRGEGCRGLARRRPSPQSDLGRSWVRGKPCERRPPYNLSHRRRAGVEALHLAAQAQLDPLRCAAGDHLAGAQHEEPRRAQAQGLDRVAALQDHQVGAAAGRQAVAVQAQDPGAGRGHRVEAGPHLGAAGHLADVQAHVRDLQHVVAAQAVPGVHHAVVAEGDVEAGGGQLLDPGHPAPLGIAVVAALQGDVDQRLATTFSSASAISGISLAT